MVYVFDMFQVCGSRQVWPCELSHINVLTGVEVSASHQLEQLSPKPHSYVAMLHYTTVCSLQEYMSSHAGLQDIDNVQYERTVVYMMCQILHGLVYLHSQGCGTEGLHWADLLVVTSGGYDEPYIVLNPHTLKQALTTTTPQQTANCLVDTLLQLLNINTTRSATTAAIPPKTHYSKGLQKLGSILDKESFEMFVKCKDVCEMLLWGPGEETCRALCEADDPYEAFASWQAVEMCRIVAHYATDPIQPSLQQACLMRFLVSANETTLYNTATLLYS